MRAGSLTFLPVARVYFFAFRSTLAGAAWLATVGEASATSAVTGAGVGNGGKGFAATGAGAGAGAAGFCGTGAALVGATAGAGADAAGVDARSNAKAGAARVNETNRMRQRRMAMSFIAG
ncbi:hypothetical protein [Burkholderia gladioli]|uniref:hypothetical protein n=1 Tax=Burkholderia gladioli TaxID=28095 RepID=UPI001C5DEB07|nr:hypothetical protein [Burkholderia gladioli]MBW5287877.1 hypothetical protein [Burkholderia gladioli]